MAKSQVDVEQKAPTAASTDVVVGWEINGFVWDDFFGLQNPPMRHEIPCKFEKKNQKNGCGINTSHKASCVLLSLFFFNHCFGDLQRAGYSNEHQIVF